MPAFILYTLTLHNTLRALTHTADLQPRGKLLLDRVLHRVEHARHLLGQTARKREVSETRQVVPLQPINGLQCGKVSVG
jgi:hypothetical protein